MPKNPNKSLRLLEVDTFGISCIPSTGIQVRDAWNTPGIKSSLEYTALWCKEVRTRFDHPAEMIESANEFLKVS